MKRKTLIERRNVTSKEGKKIQQLHEYFKGLIKKGELTISDFKEFGVKAMETCDLFRKYYLQIGDNFLNDAGFLLSMSWKSTLVDNMISEWKKLPDENYVLMKDWSKKFITRINKHFEPVLIRKIKAQSAIEDSKDILERASKLSYRWASGIIISNHIAYMLIRLAKKTKGNKKLTTDDIKTLYDILKANTKNTKLKAFLTKSYRRFEDADKTRNRCAHINEGEPTKQEIDQSIALARLLQRYLY